jgi:RNA polymerase sigma factor (sigma-70 family)
MWSWLACAARSAARDLHRTGGRYRRAIERFSEWLRFRQFVQSPSSEDSRLLSALDAALADLPASERQLIEARYFERLPLEDIGVRCGTTARGIESRLARVRTRLRQLIAAELRRQTYLP